MLVCVCVCVYMCDVCVLCVCVCVCVCVLGSCSWMVGIKASLIFICHGDLLLFSLRLYACDHTLHHTPPLLYSHPHTWTTPSLHPTPPHTHTHEHNDTHTHTHTHTPPLCVLLYTAHTHPHTHQHNILMRNRGKTLL